MQTKGTDESKLYVTQKYRCFVIHQKQTEDIFLSLCGVENCNPSYLFRARNRPGYHLHIILSGKGTICVNSKEQELHMGQMFITKPGEDTWYGADQNDPWTYCWMTFDGKRALDYVESAGFREGVNWLHCNVDPQRFYALVRRVLDKPELTLANDLLRLGSLLEFIGLAIESNYMAEQGLLHRHEYAPDFYVQYAMDFINENYANVKIADVARYIGIHRSYLTGIFKNKLGISPQEYLMQCRFKQGARLLLETEMPIQDVSRSVGYDNPLTLSKMFKRFYGLSPSEYRLEDGEGTQSDEQIDSEQQKGRPTK